MKINKSYIFLMALIIGIVLGIFNKKILEGFRQGRRFFWGFSAPSRNSSYDIRGDNDIRTIYKPKETGVFANSGLYPNFDDVKR